MSTPLNPNATDLVSRISALSPATRAARVEESLSRMINPVPAIVGDLVRTAAQTGPATRTPAGDPVDMRVILYGASGDGHTMTCDRIRSGGRLVTREGKPDTLPGSSFGLATSSTPARTAFLRDSAAGGRGVVTVLDDFHPTVSDYTKTQLRALYAGMDDREPRDGLLSLVRSVAPGGASSALRGWDEAGLEPLTVFTCLSGFLDRGLYATIPQRPWKKKEAAEKKMLAEAACDLPAVPVGVQVTAGPAAAKALRSKTGVAAGFGFEHPAVLKFRLWVKLASLAALYHGDTEISDEVWAWALEIMEHSDRTLAWMREERRPVADDA